MKKPSKQVRNNILNALLIIGTIAIVIIIGAKNGDIGSSFDAILHADLRWLLLGLGLWIASTVCEAFVNQTFFIQQGQKISFRSTLHITYIGSYYSNITPAATGGQPMQVYAFKKRGVPTGISSSALTVKFFCFQAALLTLGAFLWITNAEFVNSCAEGGKWLILTGFIINSVSVLAVVLLAINRNIVRFLIVLILRLGYRFRIVKDLAASSSKADAALDDFKDSVDMLTHHPFHLLILLLISYLHIILLMSVSYCVYRSLGLSTNSYVELLTLQLLLFIAASFTPLPGASGAQEGGFALMFSKIIPGDLLLAALLLWRFCTYYFAILLGLVSVVSESAISIRKNRLNDNQDHINKEKEP